MSAAERLAPIQSMPPFGRLSKTRFALDVDLSAYSTQDLARELVRRLQAGQAHPSLWAHSQHLGIMAALRDLTEKELDAPEYRMSLAKLKLHFYLVCHSWQHYGLPVRDAVLLEIGSGSANPLARMFTHLMAGAQRAWCLDLDPPEDESVMLKNLARIAAETLIDPTRLFLDYPIERSEIIDHLAGFDLAKLRNGDSAGIDRQRIDFLQRSATDTGLPDDCVDVVISHSVLEHLPDVDAVLCELSRITKPGGYALHGIDVIDHRCYADPRIHPLEFLTIQSDDSIVFDCNRLRLCDFERKFGEHGYRVLHKWPYNLIPVSTIRNRLVEPWRSMTDAQLDHTWTEFLVQRIS